MLMPPQTDQSWSLWLQGEKQLRTTLQMRKFHSNLPNSFCSTSRELPKQAPAATLDKPTADLHTTLNTPRPPRPRSTVVGESRFSKPRFQNRLCISNFSQGKQVALCICFKKELLKLVFLETSAVFCPIPWSKRVLVMCEAVGRRDQTSCLVDNPTAKGEMNLLYKLSMRPCILVPTQKSNMCLWQERNTPPDKKAHLSAQLVKKHKLSMAHRDTIQRRETLVG